MFVQVMHGKTSDPEALHRRLEVWEAELMPGAVGYLGSTGGCTSDGDCILIARFEDREAARRNSDRPEQGAWWAETEKCFDGPVTFHDTEDVDLMTHGGVDSARQDRIDPNPLRPELGGQRLGQADQPGFARSVGGDAGKCGTVADEGGGEDHRAAALSDHLRDLVLRAQE